MKPVESKKIGDCWRACLATILDLEYEDVPFLGTIEKPDLEWYEKSMAFLNQLGLGYMEIQPNHESNQKLQGYHLIIGDSPRIPNMKHAVVARDGIVVYDPHPDGQGVVEGTETYGLFTMLNPAMIRRLNS